METMSHQYPDPSQRSAAICDMYVKEVDRAASAEKGIHSPFPEQGEGGQMPSPFEHVQMCREYLQEEDEMPDVDEILSPEVLATKIKEIKRDAHLKINYSAGSKIVITLVPFTDLGSALTHEEIEDGMHVRKLIKDENGEITDSFSSYKDRIDRLIPAEFLECSFVVPPYDNDKIDQPTEDDYLRIEQLYTEAFNKLKEKFKMAIAN